MALPLNINLIIPFKDNKGERLKLYLGEMESFQGRLNNRVEELKEELVDILAIRLNSQLPPDQMVVPRNIIGALNPANKTGNIIGFRQIQLWSIYQAWSIKENFGLKRWSWN